MGHLVSSGDAAQMGDIYGLGVGHCGIDDILLSCDGSNGKRRDGMLCCLGASEQVGE